MIFRNGQPDCDDDCRMFVGMTSTYVQRNLVWVGFASAAEQCPENYYTGHKLKNNVRVVKCKFHTLVMLEYCY